MAVVSERDYRSSKNLSADMLYEEQNIHNVSFVNEEDVPDLQTKFGADAKAPPLQQMRKASNLRSTRTQNALEYSNKFLKRNELSLYYSSFKRLDNIINLFFFSYNKLTRSSLYCARLWVGVMKIRTIMVNAMTHLAEQPGYASVEYRRIRNEERINHINTCDIVVAKAVQFIVTFKKHAEEQWRFLRKGFLNKLSLDLSTRMEQVFNEWKEYIVKVYEIGEAKKEAYFLHLENEEEDFRKLLVPAQESSETGKADKRFFHSLTEFNNDLKTFAEQILTAQKKRARDKLAEIELPKEVTERLVPYVHNDMFLVRVLVSVCSDIYGVQSLTPDFEMQRHEVIDSVERFLSEFLRINQATLTAMEDDDKIWPHQQGLSDLGPFELIQLREPEKYIKFSSENSERPVAEYKILKTLSKVKGLEQFNGKAGKATKASHIPYEENEVGVRKALKIPAGATMFRWFFPIDAPDATEEQSVFAISAASKDSPLHVLALYGGFAYFNEGGRCLGINAVTLGDDLFFDGPYFIQDRDGFERLANNGVGMEDVTLSFIRDVGAVKFGWLAEQQDLDCFRLQDHNMGKEFGSKDNNTFKGAFFYQYDNSEHPEWDSSDAQAGGRRNYFQVLDFQELNLKKLKNSNTPSLQTLQFVVEQHMSNWDFDGQDSKNAATTCCFNQIQF